MNTEDSQDSFKVWATDNLIYGPIPLDTLIQWADENRVLTDTWVHSQVDNVWRLAREIAPLRRHFAPGVDTAFLQAQIEASHAVRPEELRRFSLFSSLSNDERSTHWKAWQPIAKYPGAQSSPMPPIQASLSPTVCMMR